MADPLTPLIELPQDYEHIVDELATRLHAEGRIRSTYASEPFDSRFARICEEDPSVSPDHLDDFLDIGWATARAETRGTFELMVRPQYPPRLLIKYPKLTLSSQAACRCL